MSNIPSNIILIIAGMFLASCGGNDNSTAPTEEHHDEESDVVELTDAQYNTAGIELGNIEMRTISGTIPASGFLDVPPQSKVTISVPMGGFVKSTTLLQGSRVEKGQVVAVLEHMDYIQLQQDFLEQVNQRELTSLEYSRQLELAKGNVNSQKVVEQAKANYTSAKLSVEGLKAKIQLLNLDTNSIKKGNIQSTINLYSPIAGFVTKVNTNIGAFVNPADMLFEIVNTELLHVELTIFEKDVPLVKPGQRVLFTLANETKHRIATVELIGREIGTDRSVQVHCGIQDQDRELIPGMYLNAVIETDSAHVTAVPDEAVVNFEGKNYIFVETTESAEVHKDEHTEEPEGDHAEAEYHFKMIEVGLGESELGFTEAVLPDGFDLATKIVTKGAFSLLSKMKNSEEEGGHAH